MNLAKASGDPRGELTRERIIDAAIDVFASTGYQGASTRQLAAVAGVNQPAIQYHFSSKEGLFSAVVERIAGGLEASVRDATVAIETALAENASQAVLKNALFQMLDSFADAVLDQTQHQSQGLFITRAEIENSEMLAPLGTVIAKSIIMPCASVIARITGRDDEEATLRAIAILGQIVNFKNKCLGATIRQCLGMQDFGEPMREKVKALVREHTLAILAIAKGSTQS